MMYIMCWTIAPVYQGHLEILLMFTERQNRRHIEHWTFSSIGWKPQQFSRTSDAIGLCSVPVLAAQERNYYYFRRANKSQKIRVENGKIFSRWINHLIYLNRKRHQTYLLGFTIFIYFVLFIHIIFRNFFIGFKCFHAQKICHFYDLVRYLNCS